ncbi:MAG: hypothetical protein Q9M27_02515 [Mariprofundaceae bacterium]|nr:hypothetical protein [Mariprofundaceae bacterium]
MALLFAVPAHAENPSADARFDKTGDGLVDVEDWKQMSEEEKQAYARESLRELGLDPEAGVGKGKTRADRYLEGLRSVYGP